PFNPVYLLVLTFPFIGKAVKRELQRRHYEYIFKPERVIVRENVKMTGTIEQEDAPYEEITDISSESPPWEQLVDVGDLHIHLTGRDHPVDILGLRHPDRYEDLMLGRESAEETVTDKESIEAELVDLERQYENGEIGRAEYERRYYYLQGKLDVLEAQE
ncbi:MAG: gas vesicle protein GvpG, partial [Candidatus Nanohaloarchaea archaeon]